MGPSCEEIDKADKKLKPTVVVTEQRGSVVDYLLAEPRPRYVKNDEPVNDNARKVMAVAYYRTGYDLACAGLGFAVGDLGAAAFRAGQPTIDKPFSIALRALGAWETGVCLRTVP